MENEKTSRTKRSEELKNIRKRKDGKWEYRYTTNYGRISIYAKTFREIINKKRAIILEKKKNQILLEYNNFKFKNNKPKLQDYSKKWFETYKKPFIGNSSQKMYLLAIACLNDLNIPINEVKTDDLQNIINETRNRPRVMDYLVLMLKQVFKRAIQEDFITKDITTFIQKGKKVENKGRSLTLEEQKLILENISELKIGKLILFYLLTGCRKSEALNIKESDINFNKNVIEINGTKTKNSKRYVIISERLKNMIKEDFSSFFGITEDQLVKGFRRLLKKLGISGVSIHSLRHTFSTNLYYLGVNDKQRQAYLGHASIIMTNDIYTHLDPTITREDIKQLYGDLYPF